MTDEIDNIKVEISLGDLTELKELAGYYKNAAKEREEYFAELIQLRKEVAELKERLK